MELFTGHGRRSRFLDLEESWPLDARMALFLLESAGQATGASISGRVLDRFPCRVRARLVRISDGRPESIEIFIRDLSTAYAGFLSSQPLNCDDEYQLHFTPSEAPLQISCLVGRSREFTDGWHEGVFRLHASRLAQVAISPFRLAV